MFIEFCGFPYIQTAHLQRLLVSPTDDPKKTEHLLAPDGAKERLQLFKANLLEEGSFDPVVEGCAGIFHTASPFYHDVKDPQAELLDPAAKGGTLNVLRSCSKTPSVQRVVLTLSMAAVEDDGILRTPDVEVDEDWFCQSDLLRENNMWYELYKTLAEEAAWEFVKEQGSSATLNISAAAIANLINGNSAVTVKALQILELFCVSTGWIVHDCIDFSNVSHHYDDEPYTPVYWVSMEKVKSLGIDYVPLERSPKETVESLKEKGFVKFWQKIFPSQKCKWEAFHLREIHAILRTITH
ncbi:hypothetical protein ACJRO7_012894 [Eucalyptus globulus]|uniref:3-beta hydroxysteroid dehydrogenase/isomerase domain-containing protein n=1 Tax=Eucalyptus globulus TaxID=34317 RepID=A0ABD3LNM9_EUCGL